MHPHAATSPKGPVACHRALALAAGLAAAPIASLAQPEPAAASPEAAQSIVIYGTVQRDAGFAPTQSVTAGKAPMRQLETPRSVSIVTREVMDSRQITNLQQALQTVAGVSPVNFGRRGFDDINIRGFRSTESILIDGLVQSPGMWTRLTSYAYERFEVLKGASSILYGQVQPGGIVNAVSKRPETLRRLDGVVELGSYGLRTLSADINLPLSDNGRTAVRLTAQASDTDDPTAFVFRKDRWLAPALSFDLGRNTDLVIFSSFSQSQWLRQQGVSPFGTLLPNPNGSVPLTRFGGEPSFGNYDIEQVTLGYSVEHRVNQALTLRQNVRYEEESGTGNFVANGVLRPDRRLQNRTAARQYMDYDILATDSSALLHFQTGPVRHLLVAGLDARTGTSSLASRTCTIGPLDLFQPVYGQAAVCPANLTNDAPSRLRVTGLYLQDQLKFGSGWTALLGVRHDRSRSRVENRLNGRMTETSANATVGSAGIVKALTPQWSAYASYAESFLPVAGTTFAGSPFEPETGQQWEVGIKHEGLGGRLTASFALFDLYRQNVPTADPVNTGFSVQTGEQRSKGAEIELGLQMHKGLKLTAGYAYTDAKVTRDNNAALVGRAINLQPLHVLSVWGLYDLPFVPRARLGLGGRHVSEQRGALPFTLPAYTVLDATLAYAGEGWRVTAGVKNLTDERYFDGAINQNVVSPAAPRTWTLGLNLMY